MISWVSGNKMFIFGGIGNGKEYNIHYPEFLETIHMGTFWFFNNQLVYYDCQHNSWNWPMTNGVMPTPRHGHQAFHVEGLYKKENLPEMYFRSLAFVFGGWDANGILNDLYFLDIETMTWQVVNNPTLPTTSDLWPEPRAQHSLTLISREAAVLFGGYNFIRRKTMGDCWLLSVECILNGQIEYIWTRCKHHENNTRRDSHKAVQEPSTRRVWLTGGFKGLCQHADHIRELTFTAPPLKDLALESAAEHFEKLAPEIQELPKKDVLRQAIESKAQQKLMIT